MVWKLKKKEEDLEPLEIPMEEEKQEIRQNIRKIEKTDYSPITKPVAKPKERIQVVRELPATPIRDYQDKDGRIVHLVTIEEALTEMLNE